MGLSPRSIERLLLSTHFTPHADHEYARTWEILARGVCLYLSGHWRSVGLLQCERCSVSPCSAFFFQKYTVATKKRGPGNNNLALKRHILMIRFRMNEYALLLKMYHPGGVYLCLPVSAGVCQSHCRLIGAHKVCARQC